MKDQKTGTEDAATLIDRWGYREDQKALIIGTLPLPVGGVSTHLMRLLALLSRYGIQPDVFDPSKSKIPGYNFGILFFKILLNGYQQIHIHSSSAKTLWAVSLAHKIVRFDIFFHVHNPVLLQKASASHRKTIRHILKRSSRIISVSEESKNKILEIVPEVENRIVVQSSFIPPDASRLPELESQYPDKLKDFLGDHYPILIINAFQIHFYNGIDVYGVDLSIELLVRLSAKYPNVGLIIALGKKSKSTDYLKSLIDRLDNQNLRTHLYLLESCREIWPLFTRCDLMLRPTLYDGYGISVTEALLMGCPVVASDSAQRQKECHLFKSRDIVDLERVCREVLDESKPHKMDDQVQN